jgi:methionine biosynthesis protein MetW
MNVGEGAASSVRGYYDSYWAGPVTPHYDPGDVLTGLVHGAVGPGCRCLDVGCGPGQTYAQVIRAREAEYVGVDVSEVAVELARKNGLQAERIDDAATLPFEDDSFDVAICIEVLEHLFSPDGAVAEIRRVLRPGGRLICSTPNAAYWRLRANLLFGVWNPLGDSLSVEQPWRDPHIRFFTPEIMERMLERTCFEGVAVGTHGGCFLDHMTTRPTSFGTGRIYSKAAKRFPSLLGMTIHAEAVK